MSRKIVSDHAVIRYLECVYGVDVSGLKRRIAAATQEGRTKGNTNVLTNGVRFRLSMTGRVKTVHHTGKPPPKHAQRRNRRIK